ncbi:hypothetical protein B0H19DRAFT_1231794 [Mycena capillaripes]|nr:hypothetical protein B0H19DRAFT_1231794 [Mycena capillaripes]
MFSRFFSDFFSDPPQPAPAGMRVVPCSALDVEKREVVLTTSLVIDARLNAAKLEHSLSTLIERKFPRAGARLAIRNRALEFQIPCVFDSQTPAIAFTAEHYHEPYESHARPDIRSLVNSSDSEPTFSRFPLLRTYLVSEACPTSTEEFLRLKAPTVHVHVSVFDDLTLIGVTSSHVVFEAPGLRTLLHAWTSLLAGHDIEAIPGMDWDMAPFESFLGPTAVWGVRGARTPFSGPIGDTGLVLGARMEERPGVKSKGSGEWVSTSDVLLAWWFKTSYSFQKIDDTTPVFIHIAVNLRRMRIFPSASVLTEPYINNASSTICVPPLFIKDFRAESIGDLALRIRRATAAYEEDLVTLEHELRWRNEDRWIRLLRGPLDFDAETELQTNWCDARLSELDFSEACAPGGDFEKKRARVLLVLTEIVMAEECNRMPLRGNGTILMEDENAFWMKQIKGHREWENLRQSGNFNFI